ARGPGPLLRRPALRARRDGITARYNQGLSGIDELRLPARRAGADPMWHLYPLRIRDGRRRRLFEHLRANGIAVQVNYLPVYWHPVYADLGYRRGTCPVAEEYYAQEISLPLFPGLTDADVDRVIDLIRGFVGACALTVSAGAAASRGVLGRGTIYTVGTVAPILTNASLPT